MWAENEANSEGKWFLDFTSIPRQESTPWRDTNHFQSWRALRYFSYIMTRSKPWGEVVQGRQLSGTSLACACGKSLVSLPEPSRKLRKMYFKEEILRKWWWPECRLEANEASPCLRLGKWLRGYRHLPPTWMIWVSSPRPPHVVGENQKLFSDIHMGTATHVYTPIINEQNLKRYKGRSKFTYHLSITSIIQVLSLFLLWYCFLFAYLRYSPTM